MMHELVISFDHIMLKWSTSNTPKSPQNDCFHCKRSNFMLTYQHVYLS